MAWISKRTNEPEEQPKPDSERGTAFASGSIWQDEGTGRRYRFEGYRPIPYTQNDPHMPGDPWGHDEWTALD